VNASPPVRWGFIGAGFVASRAMAPAVLEAPNAMLQVVAARDPARAIALHPVRVVHSYDDVCDASDVDAVYISLANDDHLPWVLRAISAGKHVLCEKPLGLSGSEVEKMMTAANDAGVLVVEAAWNRWHPRTRYVEALLAKVDEARDVHTWFTFDGVASDNYRLDPSRGGGALLDVGCYCIAAAHWATASDELTVVEAKVVRGDSGVDLTTAATLLTETGTARIKASIAETPSQGLLITTPSVQLEFLDAPFTSWREPSGLRLVKNGVEVVEMFPRCNAYTLMVEAVSSRVAGEDAWVLPLSASLATAHTLDAVRSEAALS